MNFCLKSLVVFAIAFFSQAKAIAHAAPSHANAVRRATSSSQLPQTNLLGRDLLQARTNLMSLSARTRRVEKTVKTARNKVAEASEVVRGVNHIDDLLIRVNRQLDPISKLPPTPRLAAGCRESQRVAKKGPQGSRQGR